MAEYPITQDPIIINVPAGGMDGQSVKPKGTWSDTEQYSTLDLVSYNGSSYVALKTVPAGTLPTDTDYWQLSAQGMSVVWGDITGDIEDQTDLQDALAGKADASSVYSKTEVDTALAGKADKATTYTKTETDTLLSAKADTADLGELAEKDTVDWDTDIFGIPSEFPPEAHKHDDRYYTEQETDALLADKADADDVYSKTETDDLLDAKADTADLGDLASLDSIAYDSNYLTGKPTLGTMSAVNDAPSDNKQYARKNGEWAEVQGGGGGSWGSITGTLSDQTDLQQALDVKADIIKANASGSVVSISDGAPYAVDALTVGVDAVQDLHGYDSPWPAGGGVNKLPNPTAQTVTKNGVTVTIDDNGAYKITGTPTGNSTFAFSITPFTTPSSGYLHLMNSSSSSDITFSLRDANESVIGSSFSFQGINRIVALSSAQVEQSVSYLYIFIASSAGALSLTFSPMILSTNTASTYSPYSNICPISGHTSATVTRTGKNVFDVSRVPERDNDNGKIVNNGNGSVTITAPSYQPNVRIDANGSAVNLTYFADLVVGQTYALSFETTSTAKYIYLGGTVAQQWRSGYEKTITKEMLEVPVYLYANSAGASATISNIQIELGSTASPFEAYQGTYVTVQLGSTVYGGVMDVVNGVMRVTHAFETFDGTESDWGWFDTYSQASHALQHTAKYTASGVYWICNALKSCANDMRAANVNNYATMVSSGTSVGFSTPKQTLDEFKAWVGQNNLQICYELAEPQTVTLSPETLSTLLGNNVIWADTGNIIALTYRADTQKYIDRKVAETATLTRAMIADSATADGKAPNSLSTGDLIIVGDELRKATANIGSGSAITNSNSAVATLADVIKALQ